MRSTQQWVATLATAFFMLLIRTDAIIVKRQSQANEPLDVQASGIGTVGKQHPQEFDFEFDTRSNATWVASYTLGFDGGYHFDGIPLNRTDSTVYVDGTSASGLVYLDDVTIAGLTARNLELIVADRMDKTDNLAQNDYASAFIGMRYAPHSGSDRKYTGFFETLVMQNVIKESEFGFYIGRSGKASELTLGGRDQSKCTGEIGTAPVIKQGHWTIKVDSISVGSHPITDFDGDEFIVDTGTTVIIVPERIASQLHANIPGAYSIGQQPAGTIWLSMWSYPCNTSDERMPSFRIANHSLAISKEDFGQYPEDPKDGDCISKITGNDDIPLILGTPFLRTWYTVFHWGEPTEGSEVGNGTSVQFAKAVHVQ